MDNNNLQYTISDWHDISKCMSNNSDQLYLSVCEFVQNDDIKGLKISVKHKFYGTLMSYTIDPKGDLITDVTSQDLDLVTTEILLNELKRYGFYITYVEEENLPEGQVQLLRTIRGLKFDKIRLCRVYDSQLSYIRVTAFNILGNEYWLNSGYSPSAHEWEKSILGGTAFNVSGLAEASKYSWSWLYNKIIDLEDLLARYDDESE